MFPQFLFPSGSATSFVAFISLSVYIMYSYLFTTTKYYAICEYSNLAGRTWSSIILQEWGVGVIKPFFIIHCDVCTYYTYKVNTIFNDYNKKTIVYDERITHLKYITLYYISLGFVRCKRKKTIISILFTYDIIVPSSR